MKLCLQKDVYTFHNDTGSMWAGRITPGDNWKNPQQKQPDLQRLPLCQVTVQPPFCPSHSHLSRGEARGCSICSHGVPCKYAFSTDVPTLCICSVLAVLCCSVTQSCPTLCNPTDCGKPGFPVLHHLLEFAQNSL